MITITCTIQLESTDLTDLIDNANWERLLAILSPAAAIPEVKSPPRTLPVAPRRQFVRTNTTEVTERPALHDTQFAKPNGAASEDTHETAAIDAATAKVEDSEQAPKPIKRNTRPQPLLLFADFDKLARSELMRLSIDGRIPGHKLWDGERDPRLPTLTGVLQRYKCATLAELAGVVGLEPPLRGNHAPLGRETATIEQ